MIKAQCNTENRTTGETILMPLFHTRIAVIIGLLLVALPTHCEINASPGHAVASKGELDLRQWDFEQQGILELDGEWNFYWSQLLNPEQIRNSDIKATTVTVPGYWDDYAANTEASPTGYATYSLTIKLPAKHPHLSLYAGGQGSNYALWINNTLAAHNGVIGTSKETSTAENKTYIVALPDQGETVQIVLQISNFHHRKAGLRNTLLLGAEGQIQYHRMIEFASEISILGGLTIVSLFHLFFFLYHPRQKALLYFALIAGIFAVRVGATSQDSLPVIFPFLSWEAVMRIDYLTFFLSSTGFLLFVRSMYPQDVHRWAVPAVSGIALLFCLILASVDTLTLSYTPRYYQAVLIIEMAYFLALLVRVVMRKRDGARYFVVATLILFSFMLAEMLFLESFVDYTKISTIGFLCFILTLAAMLSSQFTESLQRSEALSLQLTKNNDLLRASEQKYRDVFNNSRDMIFIAGADGMCQDINRACEQVIGYTRKELTGTAIHKLMVKRRDRERMMRHILKGQPFKDFEAQIARKQGDEITVLVNAGPILDKNGNASGFQGTIRDISIRKIAESETRRAKMLEELASTDSLTKVHNRRFFQHAAEVEIECAQKTGSPLSLILFDIDHFKAVNDSYGHKAGDRVLKEIASLCAKEMRSKDIFARYGGEEFVILMPDTTGTAALISANRLRDMVAEATTNTNGHDIKLTISAGISCWENNGMANLDQLEKQADQALYESKGAGRNRCTLWRDLS
ncbi:MAG: diguanylate cyclase [Pseudomonadales bacterium]